MAVNAYTTAVKNLVARLVVLEPLSIAQVYTGSVTAHKQWLINPQAYPYWANRIRRYAENRQQHKIDVTGTARLVLASTNGATRIMEGTEDVQELSWQFPPEVLAYFGAIRTTLAPSGYSSLGTLTQPDGFTISCPAGLEYALNPYTGAEALYMDFEWTAPLRVSS